MPDAAFQRAYAALSACHRSWLKLCIARLCDHFGGGLGTAFLEQGSSVRHASGLERCCVSRPLSWCVVLLDEAMVSAPRLLATVLPPILAGVGELWVVRLCGRKVPWPPSLLTALELAGVEQVAQCRMAAAPGLLTHLARGEERGAVLMPQRLEGLSRQAWLDMVQAPRLRVWHPLPQKGIGLYIPTLDASPWDFETLAWSQPDLAIEVWVQHPDPNGVRKEDLEREWALTLPAGCTPRQGDASDFLEQGFGVVYAPPEMHEAALRGSWLALGPGQEGCWIWPDLQPCFFQQHAAAWSLRSQASLGFATGDVEE